MRFGQKRLLFPSQNQSIQGRSPKNPEGGPHIVGEGRETMTSDGPFDLRKVEAGLYGVLNQNFKPTRLGLYLTWDFSDLPKFKLKRK